MIQMLSMTVVWLAGATWVEESPRLTGEDARGALVALIRSDAESFVSPGRAERAQELEKAEILVVEDGFQIGQFWIDVEERSYQVSHLYGKPGEGRWEEWRWEGQLRFDRERGWIAEKPQFTKAWGE